MLVAARAEVAAAEAEAEQIALERERLGIAEADRLRLEAEVARLEAQNERYEHIIAQLRRLQFGKRSEQLDKDQLQLAFEDLVQGLAEIEPETTACPCCAGTMHVIGEDVSKLRIPTMPPRHSEIMPPVIPG